MRARWSCAQCGRSGTTRIEARVVYHPCSTTTAEPPIPYRSRLETLHEERMTWAKRALGAEVERVVGADAWLDVEEAQI